MYNIVKRVREGKSLQRIKGQGRKIKSGVKITPGKIQQIKRWALKQGVISYARTGNKFKIGRTKTKQILQSEGVKRKVRKKILHSSDDQKQRQAERLEQLSSTMFSPSKDDVDDVMDDEKYFDRNQAGFGGNKYYMHHDEYDTSPSKNIEQYRSFLPKFWYG